MKRSASEPGLSNVGAIYAKVLLKVYYILSDYFHLQNVFNAEAKSLVE